MSPRGATAAREAAGRARSGQGSDAGLSVVDRPGRAPVSTYAMGVVALTIIVLAFVATVFLRVRLAEGQRAIDSLTEEIAVHAERSDELSLELQELAAPDRVRSVAAIRLGMIPPPDVEYLAPVLPEDPATRLPPPEGDPFAPTDDGSDAADEGASP